MNNNACQLILPWLLFNDIKLDLSESHYNYKKKIYLKVKIQSRNLLILQRCVSLIKHLFNFKQPDLLYEYNLHTLLS